ncbi:glycosyltransferase family 4 protein [Stenotrophomonas sp. NLF4-10]|uniref:glycosyltransferase family 4 protein n=1 Tax=Stenotrophomonas sp. NLF4-10 TaxID=2918754 RepID=UPI001EFB36E3|nr:glycosyltransferase family 4 protein [Stenotrophomonas sp. NLF4-10]MCG8277388.1 glycosyltransferase family 4 protein [Stenotrophomonas sp. NLF4-10]
MERLNWHIADELSHHADVAIVGPEGSAATRPDQVELTEVPLRPLSRFLAASAWQALRIARRWKPDIVLAGSGLTAPAALMAARAVSARAAIYLHGLDVAVRHPVYRAIWHPAIRRMDIAIANSQPTAELAQALGVNTTRMHIVHPGVQVPDTPQPFDALQEFRQRHRLGSHRILLSIGRLTTRKGLREFVQNSLPIIVREVPDALLVIIGDVPTDALNANLQTRESIQAAADEAGIGQHLRFLGVITTPAELACAYESASAHVFPVRHIPGDPEGFGMVAIEAAAHGIPTAAFATGGIVNAVAPGQSGVLVEPGNYPALARAVLHSFDKQSAFDRDKTIAFARNFAWPNFGKNLCEALQLGMPPVATVRQ